MRKVVLFDHPSIGAPKMPSRLPLRRKSCPQSLNVYRKLRQLENTIDGITRQQKPTERWRPKKASLNSGRGVFVLKSSDTYYDPRSVQDVTSEELAILPRYYAMPLELGIHDTVTQKMTEKET